jgi:alanine-glyoxylate transaminase/serine-glyoxylate transaminase/serine-pyruvate transaminase
MPPAAGRPFLQIPGPTQVPDRIVRAMAQPIIDHRGPRFEALVRECLEGLRRVFQTDRGHIVLYPGSGTGAWEATIVNTLSPGDRVLACVNGFFSAGFARTATAFGVEVERLEVPYGAGVPAETVERRLRDDAAREIQAVTRRCCWSTPCRRSPPSTSGSTPGGWTWRSPGPRKVSCCRPAWPSSP